MIIYSQKIFRFIQEIKRNIKEIISCEVGLKVFGDRFYNLAQTVSVPIDIVIFNNRSLLGYFDAEFYELGFNESLMYSSKEQLRHVIRHEIAHYLIFLEYGFIPQPHGSEFKRLCASLGWGPEVSNATFCLDEGAVVDEVIESSVLRKIKKLMALSNSSNENEAEQAMIKSQQLLLKHHIDSQYLHEDDADKMILKRILKQPKKSAKMRAIAKILETFFVNTVYRRGEKCTYLEILGSAVNIEIAEYVSAFLQVEMEKLWKQVQKNTRLKGMVAKNSFFMGIAIGYCNKIQSLKREHTAEEIRSLMIIEKQLTEMKSFVYPRLSTGRSSGYTCAESSALGERAGRELSINPALAKNSAEGKAIAFAH